MTEEREVTGVVREGGARARLWMVTPQEWWAIKRGQASRFDCGVEFFEKEPLTEGGSICFLRGRQQGRQYLTQSDLRKMFAGTNVTFALVTSIQREGETYTLGVMPEGSAS